MNDIQLNLIQSKLVQLHDQLDGDVLVDPITRKLYSTDASVYQEIPAAVAIPRSDSDIKKLIEFANSNRIGIIPRTAGTSLAGQVVGAGIIVDVSKHFCNILETNVDEKWVRVQPGVIRDELNRAIARHGILFGPETATANRAMLGGMFGNNSCGANSIAYGSVRDQIHEASGFLSDGSYVTFGPLSKQQFNAKLSGPSSLERDLYRKVEEILHRDENRIEIRTRFPKPSIRRRNTGYALDQLMDCAVFGGSTREFNMCQLLTGSEGTLFFATDVKLRCHELPPPETGVQCAHFDSIDQALKATQIAVSHSPFACELIDHHIIEGARRNLEQTENTGFVQGTPAAILITQFRGMTEQEVVDQSMRLENELREQQLGTCFPVLMGPESEKVWALRKSGLGVVSNMPGDTKPVAFIEDTAVDVADLPQYIADFNELLNEKYGIDCVHYAHAGSGEIHLRPLLNLKSEHDVKLFRDLALDVAQLVKRFRGSLSGEHGDGRLRSEFIVEMVGSKNYGLMQQIKTAFDPHNILNPNKIVDPPPMDRQMRYNAGQPTREMDTVLDFSSTLGIQRAAEMCNGSGDCRKTELSGGTMCPSYHATRNEQDSTRARANILRHVLTGHRDSANLASKEINQVMDLCLSCKACKRECPSNVNVAKLKAEASQAFQDKNGVSLRTRFVANFDRIMSLASIAPRIYNFLMSNRLTSRCLKWMIGFHSNRSIPPLSRMTLTKWMSQHQPHENAGSAGKVFLFCDEFTNYLDVQIGIATVEALEILGFDVTIPSHVSSGRSMISKGLLRKARSLAESNVERLSIIVSAEQPLVGIEPSAILSFRDEYPDLVRPDLRDQAHRLAKNTMTIEEFVCIQFDAGKISRSLFTSDHREIKLHGHCHQKALGAFPAAIKMLQIPANYSAKVIPTGCCGMAGSFGFEKEHFELSNKIGELVLFPNILSEQNPHLLATSGTSCRHQILDGTGRKAQHPIEILRAALVESS